MSTQLKPALSEQDTVPADADPEETSEWIDSLAEVISRDGLARAEFLVDQLIESGRAPKGRRTG